MPRNPTAPAESDQMDPSDTGCHNINFSLSVEFSMHFA